MDHSSKTRKERNAKTYASATHPNDDDAPIIKRDPIILREPTYGLASPFPYIEYVLVTAEIAAELTDAINDHLESVKICAWI